MEKPVVLQQQKQTTPIPQPSTTLASPTTPQATQSKHVLFDLTQIEVETEEIEGKTQRCYTIVKQMIAGKAASECQEIYLKHISLNQQQHTEDVTVGLLVAILIEPQGQGDYYNDIVKFSKDNLALFSNFLNMIIIERITRVSHHSLKQIFWVANQLIKDNISSAENTCSNLIRQTAKGDLSARNLYMVENLLDVLSENRAWLLNSTSFMGPTVIYNLTRLILDHLPVSYNVIRQREIEFVIGLIREKFEFVLSIGKDFLRLLNSLQRVGGFHQLFQDIYINDPKELHPNYEGVKQLFAARTPRRLFQSCLTFDMERKISYLATQVKFGNQKRYQDCFHKQYLTVAESAWLRSDLIRYICTIIHPSNEVLCSDIIPRWAIIGWLLTTVNHVVIQCGPALFFDWFAFDPKSDNIMNIEPAILVMYYSLRSHPQVTALLLDYLCRAPTSFNWKLQDTVRISIKKSLQQILEKRVLPSLTPLFVNPKYDNGLKARIKENFPEYCPADNGVNNQNNVPTIASSAAAINSSSSTSQPATPSVATDTLNFEPCIKGEVITIDDGPYDNSQTQSSQDTLKANQDNCNNLPTVALGFQPPAKIQMPSNYSPNKSSNAKIITNTGEIKNQPNPNRNGTDPIEALINVGPIPTTSSVPKAAPTLPATSPKKVSNTPVIKQELSSEDAHRRSVDCSLANQIIYSNDASNYSAPDLQLDSIDESKNIDFGMNDRESSIRVIYPFMTVKKVLSDEVVESFGDGIIQHLNHMHRDMSCQDRALHTRKLLEMLSNSLSPEPEMIDNLGCHIANLISEDFDERIHSTLRENMSYKRASEISPLFVLGHHYANVEQPKPICKALLAAITKYFEAASFLILYYMRLCQINLNANLANYGIPKAYHSLCDECKRKDPTKSLIDDMKMMLTYDIEMFCFMLPLIFADFSHSEPYNVINNCELIRIVVANIDPMSLQEFMCLCLTGSSKIISREDPLEVIEQSLNWESWEQYFFWKILTAQSVPIENYISILPKLNAKKHPEAMSSIMFNLQKLSEPSLSILQAVIDAYNKQNEQFVAAIIRYWSIRSDLKEMTKNIISLSFDSAPPSPPAKRKGQAKTSVVTKGGSASSNSSASSSITLTARGEKILLILDSIRRRAPRNKLLAQAELLDTFVQLEPLCNDNLKPKLSVLLQARQRPTKRKKSEKE